VRGKAAAKRWALLPNQSQGANIYQVEAGIERTLVCTLSDRYLPTTLPGIEDFSHFQYPHRREAAKTGVRGNVGGGSAKAARPANATTPDSR
jgi:hypothetical protein